MKIIRAVLCAAVALTAAAPATAVACGGLFCDNSQPVTQAAERILFAREGDTLHMIVRLTYDGPPIEFGWLLPAPADVETTVSSEALFQAFDRQYAPIFRLTNQFADGCEQVFPAAEGGGAFDAGVGAADMGAQGPDVQVLSREAVGPYDRVILQARTVEDLTQWLRENEFQFPEGSEDRLRPYVELGSAFVALKLLPGADSNDVVPLHLTFTSDSPAIPLRPTAVAAEPDMGIIVHLLGEHRAVPTNFLHVVINEAAIDWPGGGQNYADVVAAAADEAEGHAFATDYAGEAMNPGLPLVDEAVLTAVAEVGTLTELGRAMNLFSLDADLQRVVRSAIVAPEGASADDILRCPDCYDPDFGYDGPAIEVDGAALAQRLGDEINAPREQLATLFEQHGYMTRLFTRMSAAEMDRDPIFAFNPDLQPVPQTRDATRHIGCDDGGFPDFDNAVIELADGQRVALEDGQMPGTIARQAGETVRGAETQAAALIEQAFAAGQPEEQDRMDNPRQDPLPGANGGGGGCTCDVGDSAPTPLTLLALLGLVALRRRRRGEG